MWNTLRFQLGYDDIFIKLLVEFHGNFGVDRWNRSTALTHVPTSTVDTRQRESRPEGERAWPVR